MNHSKHGDSGDESDDDDRLDARDGLSASVLAALLEFQHGGGCFQRIDNDAEASRDAVCAVNRPEDSAVIAATFLRLDEKYQASNDDGGNEVTPECVVGQLQIDPTRSDWAVLEQEGVVRVNNVLSNDMCDACLDYISDALLNVHPLQPDQTLSGYMGTQGFGKVHKRDNRCDMYLRNEGAIDKALHQMLQLSAPLGQLFHRVLGGQHADFHELSSLLADPGCVAQPIHPDAPFHAESIDTAPLWTCFIALQTVTANMGGTVFLPRTHTASSHALLQNMAPGGAQDRRQWLQNECTYRRADLQRGDCAVMDARTLHYGGANTTMNQAMSETPQRRTLLYFTIRNPIHTSGYPTCGSLYDDLDGVLTTYNYIQ